MKQRVKWIDIAKGICMISVILGHLGVPEINDVVYAYHLSLFFILSGYTMKKNAVNMEYLNKKFNSLLRPYFITCFCIILLDIFNCFMLWHNTSGEYVTNIIANDIIKAFWASGAITNFGAIEIGLRIGVIWFLPALFFSLIFVQVIINYIENKKIQCIIVAVCAFAGMVSARFIWLPFSIQSALMAAPYILLGYEIRQRNWINRLNLKVFLGCLIIFLLGIKGHISLISFVNADAPDFFLSFIVGVASSLCVIYISIKVKTCRPLELIGKYSLYFMCIHLLEAEQMGSWKWNILEYFGINNKIVNFVVPLLLISFIVFLIITLKKAAAGFKTKGNKEETGMNENTISDIAMGGLVILLILGNYEIAPNFRNIVYSFHMMAFVFYLGYCFNGTACENMKYTIWGLIKTFLFPYGCFSVIYCLITHEGIEIEVKNVLLAFSSSIGAAYFVLLLFLVSLLYLCIEKYINQDWKKHVVVLLFSLSGYFIGKLGFALPWNADIAAYSILFYHIGHCFKKCNIMSYVCNRYYWYFLLSVIWAYMIYQGGMEIPVRRYGNYSWSLLGVVCGSLLLYMFSGSILKTNGKIVRILEIIGKSYIYILIVHTLFNYHVYKLCSRLWEAGTFPHLVVIVIIQVFVGMVIALSVNKMVYRKRG
ncbi:MAG: acyltransferase family protein [Alistipes sp.]|nr:acyltransferase family protein [Alistipes sp.]